MVVSNKMDCPCPVISPDRKTVICRPPELNAPVHFNEVPLPFRPTKASLSNRYETPVSQLGTPAHLSVIQCLKYDIITEYILLHGIITEIQAIRDWETKLVKYKNVVLYL